MNLLVVGVSHHTAPVDLLERVAVDPATATTVLVELVGQPHVNEAVVLSTCNRVEIYAGVTTFHGGLAEIGAVLAARAGLDVAELIPHLYVHHNAEAVRHALRVASGLDSMVVGEAQILGQLRDAYGLATDADTAGRLLHELMQQALRVGKRVHAETGIDRTGQSVVSAALALVPGGVKGRTVLVVGAGSMGALALATLNRAGAGPLYITNRGAERAARLAEAHEATAMAFDDLATVLSTVNVVICATASPSPVLTADLLASARAPGTRPIAVLDLAVPRDVAPEVAELADVTLIDIDTLGAASLVEPSVAERGAAESIVADEVETFLLWLRGTDVAPTVAALRARADELVEAELRRLIQRRPELTEEQRAEVAHAIHRIVQRLLHSPTVRVRQFASTADGDQYVAALRELFDLSVPSASDDLGRAVEVESAADLGEESR
jgi:glutamyl-tRNA reductase